MKLGTMLSDVFRSLFRRTATRQYPFERQPGPPSLRGKLHWDAEKCTGCCLCSKDCPAKAIEVVLVDKAEKRMVVRYHADRCTYCAQCVFSCPQNALQLAPDEWELAGTDKQLFTICYGDAADVEQFLVSHAQTEDVVAQEN